MKKDGYGSLPVARETLHEAQESLLAPKLALKGPQGVCLYRNGLEREDGPKSSRERWKKCAYLKAAPIFIKTPLFSPFCHILS